MRAELSSNSFYKRKIMKRRWEIRQNRRKMINSFLYGLKRELITPSKNNEIIQAIICGLITMFLMGIILVRAIGGWNCVYKRRDRTDCFKKRSNQPYHRTRGGWITHIQTIRWRKIVEDTVMYIRIHLYESRYMYWIFWWIPIRTYREYLKWMKIFTKN